MTHTATLVTDLHTLSVTGAYGTDGDAVPITTNSTQVTLRCTGAFAAEYRLDGGEWVQLLPRQSTTLDINLAASDLRLRKGRNSATTEVRADVERLIGLALNDAQDALTTRSVDVSSASAGGPSAMQLVVGGVTYNPARSLKIEAASGTYYVPMFGPV